MHAYESDFGSNNEDSDADSDYDDQEAWTGFEEHVSELNESMKQAQTEAEAAELSIHLLDESQSFIDLATDSDGDNDACRRVSMEARDEAVARSKKEAEEARAEKQRFAAEVNAEKQRLVEVARAARARADDAGAKKAALIQKQEQKIRDLRQAQAAAETLAAQKVARPRSLSLQYGKYARSPLASASSSSTSSSTMCSCPGLFLTVRSPAAASRGSTSSSFLG